MENNSFEGRLPAPKYDNPAALGGSFVVNCATRTDTLSGPLPIIKTDQIEAKPVAVEPRSTQLVSKRVKRPAMKASMQTSCILLFDLIEASLESKSADEWDEFWCDNLDDYNAIVRTVSMLREKLERGSQDDTPTVSAALAKRFPMQAAMLREVYATVAAVTKLTRTFGPVLPKFDTRDVELAHRFAIAGGFYSVCALTLELAAQDLVKIPELILPRVFKLLRFSVGDLRDTASEAAKLRRSSALEAVKADLQNVLAEVRADAEPVADEELLALARAACSPADKVEKVDEWAQRLATEMIKN